jgi:benzoyl-CoA reductase/2-hydroxyglutaryl-CoA dehydratase subunit BcrC/BadD/HgdB
VTHPYFESLVSGITSTLEADPEAVSARKRFTLEIARVGSRLFSQDEPVAWCGVLTPFDLLGAMGVTSCFVEFVGGWLASIGAVEPMLETADKAGYATDCCSYHRSVIGAALAGVMPEPEFLIATSTLCSGGLATIENLARHYKKDLFTIHIPHHDNDAGVRYLADQFRSMVAFVSDHSDKHLDPERLRATVENTNRARALLVETYELAQAVPFPARRRDLSNLDIVFSLFLGTEGGVEVAQTYRDEFARKVKAGEGGVAGERVRLMWLQNRIQFKNPLEQMLEEEYATALVFDELNQIYWDPIDPDDPFTGMARRALSVPLTGPIEHRIRKLQQQARAYKVDGAINPCHWGCRQGTGGRGLVEQGLKEIGVPVLNLEVDCVDPRHFSEGQLRTRIEAFIEMLTARHVGAGRA